MRPDSPTRPARVITLLAIVIVSVSAVAGLSTSSDPRKKSAGPDGAGILPFVGPVAGRNDVVTTPTAGLVVDVQRNAVAGTLVIVTHPAIGVIAQAFTDANGHFVLNLPEIAHLEVALPDEALAGISVTAGVPLIIVVP